MSRVVHHCVIHAVSSRALRDALRESCGGRRPVSRLARTAVATNLSAYQADFHEKGQSTKCCMCDYIIFICGTFIYFHDAGALGTAGLVVLSGLVGRWRWMPSLKTTPPSNLQPVSLTSESGNSRFHNLELNIESPSLLCPLCGLPALATKYVNYLSSPYTCATCRPRYNTRVVNL
ncbi:hypothetical protein K443DRAFT_143389 [Laccaria amethystina LaAM-08-1]|uniref:Uncharacterized protein n=1 Tax=Laccaria amethystina LaAM-08-1 TaxID=1095629 RepID=A0A0C9Y875_9AGAR|nr:hypothetical protein K443DRAFT_143389 [Laccaria amethystina LaAM-08-1]